MGFYRKTLLFVQGLMYDTKKGYDGVSKCFDSSDLDEDVEGLAFLITGANSGIGFETAKAIAQRRGTVHLVCRNRERAEKAQVQIVKDTGNENVFVHVLDLSRVCDVLTFVRDFAANHTLDVLINNAGENCLHFQKTETEDLEMSFATNVVGPVLLTTGLLPLLQKSPNTSRVVNVGSTGMLLQRLDSEYFSKIQKFDGLMAYTQCKRQIAIMIEKWALEHPEIHFSNMHPGWVDTPAARKGLGEFYEKMKEKFRDPCEGADTVIWLAISKPALSIKSGSFFQDRKPISKHLPLARTRETKTEREKLFKLLTEIETTCTRTAASQA